MTLSDIVKKYLREKDSGLLSIKIDGESYLLKIYMDNGEITSISLGMCKNEGCLNKLNGVSPLEYSFIKGVKSSTPAKEPLTQKVIELIDTDNTFRKIKQLGSNTNINPQIITAVEENVIEIIGPIGKMILDSIFSKLSYIRGNPMTTEDYSYLLESLMKELPVDEQASFVTQCKNIAKG